MNIKSVKVKMDGLANRVTGWGMNKRSLKEMTKELNGKVMTIDVNEFIQLFGEKVYSVCGWGVAEDELDFIEDDDYNIEHRFRLLCSEDGDSTELKKYINVSKALLDVNFKDPSYFYIGDSVTNETMTIHEFTEKFKGLGQGNTFTGGNED